jgi:hypothetical protein
MDWTGLCSSVSIYPQRDWYLQLGYWGHQIGNIFTYGIHTHNVWYDSDSTFKTNFNLIDRSVIQDINKLKPYRYNFKEDYLKSIPEKEKKQYRKKHFGFKAQDVEKVFPELTYKDDSTGKYAIDYMGFIPILVQSIQQQQEVINAQGLYIKELNQRLTKLENKSSNNSNHKSGSINEESTGKSNSVNSEIIDINRDIAASTTFLYQNSPNPFTKQTEIKYFISSGFSTSTLLIFDLQGILIRQFNINNIGFGIVTIQASELKPGMYIYSLVCDGNEIDTKRMILSE